MLEAGSKAPSFELQDQTGRVVKLEDLRGQRVVLYFYPKDMTSGCTQEACDLRDRHPALLGRGAVVLGVSPDPVARHVKFIAKEGLPFSLLADPDHAVCERYGVWVEKTLYGRKYMGVARTTFLIDASGTIERAWHGVKVPGHADAILEALGGEEAAGVKRTAKKAAKKTGLKKTAARKKTSSREG
jgi:peroxiredoxin Q/BCP